MSPFVAVLALALLLVPVHAAVARDEARGRGGPGRAERGPRGAEPAPRGARDEAAARARRESGGRVLSIDERAPGGGYRAKVLTPEGEVRYLDVRP